MLELSDLAGNSSLADSIKILAKVSELITSLPRQIEDKLKICS